MKNLFVYYLLLFSVFGIEWGSAKGAAQGAAQETTTAQEASKVYGDYTLVRAFLLSEMSKARSRIWLYTEYLTDGDIASALFVAKYRKLDIQVLLGAAKAQAYMSRLGNLKSNQIDVFLKPRAFTLDDVTVLLVDDRLYAVDAPLDFMSKAKDIFVTTGETQDAYEFARLFATAMGEKKPAIPKQLQEVGRGVLSPAPQIPFQDFKPIGPTIKEDNVKNLAPQSHEAYHYSRVKEKRPPEVPDRLPKELKFKEQGGP